MERYSPPTPITLTVAEVATLLGVSLGVAYREVREGNIPSIRVGGRLLVPRAAFDRLLDVDGNRTVRR